MPGGANCAIPFCSTQQAKCRGLSFHSLPKRKKDAKWNAALVRAINRQDTSFNPDSAKICSRHFDDACFKYGPSGQRMLIPGSLPTRWMPTISITTPKLPPRKEPICRPEVPVPVKVAYYTFEEVKSDISKNLPPPWCLLVNSCTSVTVGMLDSTCSHVLIKAEFLDNFSVTLHVFGLLVPNTNDSVEHVKVKRYLADISIVNICRGVTDEDLTDLVCSLQPENSPGQKYFKHYHLGRATARSRNCCLLNKNACGVFTCKDCIYIRRLLISMKKRHETSRLSTLNPKAPLKTAPKDKIVAALKTSRKNEKVLERKLQAFKDTLEKDSVQVSESMHESLSQIAEASSDPVVQLFWKEQRKAFDKKQRGMRWHPMLIRLAILVHSQSPQAYKTLRDTGILKLPGSSTLRDYTNAYHPKEGISKHAIEELKRLSKDLEDEKRFVVLLHDEMTIKSDLVFDKRSGEIIGFVKTDPDGEDVGSTLASQVLVFFVVGINSNINVSLGFVGTSSANAGDLFSLLWQAVGYLEMECHLKVIASVSDKASANQKLYQLHRQPDHREEICYKAVNIFAPDRFLYFISDPPHLIKTVRNNIYKSGWGKSTNYLWCEGKHILWKHVVDLYNADCENETRFTKLTHDHISLTGASIMNVRLASQVLSSSVGKFLQVCRGDDCSETAKLCLMMNRFFDCLNGRSVNEALRKRNKDLSPYEDSADERFHFLEVEFLNYLQQWKKSTADRPGPFTQQDRNKMFLTHQTYKGLIMTVHAFCEATKYLLQNGVRSILSSIFCQDPLEEHFGRHRGLGRRCDNPNLWSFAYQETKLRTQRSLAMVVQPKGSVHNKRKIPVDICTSPLKRIKRS